MKRFGLGFVVMVCGAACIAPNFQGDDDATSTPSGSAGAGGGKAGATGGGASGASGGGGGSAGKASAGAAGAASGGGAGATGGTAGAATGGKAGASGGSGGAGGGGEGGGGSGGAQGGGAQGGSAGALGGLVELSAGHHHTCGRTTGGDVWCWGSNEASQVAADTGETCDVELGPSGPQPVACARSPIVRSDVGVALQVSAGDDHTCARTATGVSCWGDDAQGQLGDGAAGGTRGDAAPVMGLGPVVSIGAGAVSTCALDAAGAVSCWGGGSSGQLGQGTMKSSSKPVSVALGGPAKAIAVGGYHACALLETGRVACWGLNLYGELGDGSKNDSATPREVIGLTGVTSVVAGGWHACAISSGAVSCWGSNTEGQLGSGPTGVLMGSATPVMVPGAAGVDAVFAGRERTCVTKAGAITCWGSNTHGELGIGSESNGVTAPAPVLNVADAITVALGGSHTCALRPMDKRSCWGWNAFGQLGDGTTTDTSKP